MITREHDVAMKNLFVARGRPDIPARVSKWDRRFLELAIHVAAWSKDPSTKCGAVIIRPDKTVLSLGYNGFPRGMRDTPDEYADREQKLAKVIHCEMNAVLSAREPVKGCTLYTTGPNCDRCAAHMIQAGITTFVFHDPEAGFAQRWEKEIERTWRFFHEAEVMVRQIDMTYWTYSRVR